jgi:hypothetical protein
MCIDDIAENLRVKTFPPGQFLLRGKKLVERAAPLNQPDG